MDSEIYNLNKLNIKNSKKRNTFINVFKFFIVLLIILSNIYTIISFNKNINYLINIIKNKIINNSKKDDLINQNFIYEVGKKNLSLDNKVLADKIKLLKIITNNNHLIYKRIQNCLISNNPDDQYCIYHLIFPKKVKGKKKILIGEKRDGCYVLLDDFENIRIAYSFGISHMIQFDQSLADRGIHVYMYDHTINALPYNNPKFHWKKIGITGKNKKSNDLKSLDELILENGHSLEKNMILKIDVEHCEWDSLKDIEDDVLNKFKYIIIELHFRENVNEEKLYYQVIKKLHKNHQVFHLRCHNRNSIVNFGNNTICRSLEVSYVIRENNTFIQDDSIYPNYNFDFRAPNLNGKYEYNLNILKLFDF